MTANRTLILTDLHLGGLRWKPKDGSPDFYGNLAETEDERVALKRMATAAAIAYAAGNGITHLLLGGDVLDKDGEEKNIRSEARFFRELLSSTNIPAAATNGNHEEHLQKANDALTIPRLFDGSVRHDRHYVSAGNVATVVHGHQLDHATRKTHAHEWLAHHGIPGKIEARTIDAMLDWLSLAAFRSSSHLLGLDTNDLAILPTLDECRTRFLSCLHPPKGTKHNREGQSHLLHRMRILRESVGAHLASLTQSNAVVLGHSHHPLLLKASARTKKGKWRDVLVGNAGGFKEPLEPITAIEATADSLTLLAYAPNGRSCGTFVPMHSVRSDDRTAGAV